MMHEVRVVAMLVVLTVTLCHSQTTMDIVPEVESSRNEFVLPAVGAAVVRSDGSKKRTCGSLLLIDQRDESTGGAWIGSGFASKARRWHNCQ